MPRTHTDVACTNVEITAEPSREYGHAAVATATIHDCGEEFRVRRRYEGLPFHNDVVDPDAVDSNDEMIDRPDEIHVHTRVSTVDADRETYLVDQHETWRPPDSTALGDGGAFLAACREHHLAGLGRAYSLARGDRRRRDE